MPLAQDVVDRLLVAKGLLGRIQFNPAARPDRISLARAILRAHDAAELALAAIARHLDRLPSSSQTYLMQYFPAIQNEHPEENVIGRDYFSQLNRVRTDIKHHGVFPDAQQWYAVGDRTYEYVSQWCRRYLGISLDQLDESALIAIPEVKALYDKAVEAFSGEHYKKALEHLAYATETLLRSSRALRNLSVGSPHAEHAIKLATFGVNANDYLGLQEFLPSLVYSNDRKLMVRWNQDKFGHPGNWTRSATEFCLGTFVQVALRIQGADWIPGAIEFDFLYEHQVTALVDDVEIVQEQRKGFLDPPQRVVARTLHAGEFMRCSVSRRDETFRAAKAYVSGQEQKRVLSIMNLDEKLWGEVEADKVKVTCVPRDNELVREYFPGLPEVDYE